LQIRAGRTAPNIGEISRESTRLASIPVDYLVASNFGLPRYAASSKLPPGHESSHHMHRRLQRILSGRFDHGIDADDLFGGCPVSLPTREFE